MSIFLFYIHFQKCLFQSYLSLDSAASNTSNCLVFWQFPSLIFQKSPRLGPLPESCSFIVSITVDVHHGVLGLSLFSFYSITLF